jgi:hypothetical protein
MSKKGPRTAAAMPPGVALVTVGDELKKGLWENGVYLSNDGFVYHIVADRVRSDIKTSIISKRPIGEYLRWVDGLFTPGEVPGESSGIHFRAARKLREII